MACPHCGESELIHEIDVAYRWNIGEFIVEGGRIVAIGWSIGDANFETDQYQCGGCYRQVLIPDIDTIDQGHA